MAKIRMKPGTMLNPVPAVMVTCGTAEKANIVTIAWTGIINSDPPITYISVRKSRYSHDLIAENGEFVINLTTERLARATDFCGVRSGRDVNKAKETGLTLLPAHSVSCPVIAEAPVSLECRVLEVKEYPTHDMFIAQIIDVCAEEGLFDESGRLCLEQAGMLAYSHGEYFGLKREPLGRFGFSVMKPKTRKRLARKRAERTEKVRHGKGSNHLKKKKRG